MERFGGFGRHRDLGLLLYQLMSVMDFLQVGNIGAAQDVVSLLVVALDQAVMDGGKVRPSCTLDFAGGPSLNNLCQQAAKQSVEGSRLHAPPQQLFPSGIGGDCRLHASGC